jgi:hypothetical protein
VRGASAQSIAHRRAKASRKGWIFKGARYLRMAEISVGQSPPQPRDASRSAFSHTAKPTSTTTVTTSLATVLSLMIAHISSRRGRSRPVVHVTRFPLRGNCLLKIQQIVFAPACFPITSRNG